MHPLPVFYIKTASLVIGAVIAIFLVPIAILLIFGTFADQSICKNSIISEIVSPSKDLKAVIFVRDCGATTGFVTHLSIIKSDEKTLDGVGNTFIADTDHGRAPESAAGGPAIEISCTNQTHMVVTHHQSVRIFSSQNEIHGIHIKYATTSDSQ